MSMQHRTPAEVNARGRATLCNLTRVSSYLDGVRVPLLRPEH